MTTGRINQVTCSFFCGSLLCVYLFLLFLFPFHSPPLFLCLPEERKEERKERREKMYKKKTPHREKPGFASALLQECLAGTLLPIFSLKKNRFPFRDCRETKSKRGKHTHMCGSFSSFSSLVAPSRLDRSPGRRPLQGSEEKIKKKKERISPPFFVFSLVPHVTRPRGRLPKPPSSTPLSLLKRREKEEKKGGRPCRSDYGRWGVIPLWLLSSTEYNHPPSSGPGPFCPFSPQPPPFSSKRREREREKERRDAGEASCRNEVRPLLFLFFREKKKKGRERE